LIPSRLTSSRRRSSSRVVRVEAWFAIAAAFSSVRENTALFQAAARQTPLEAARGDRVEAHILVCFLGRIAS
jgi:hypothetical protein